MDDFEELEEFQMFISVLNTGEGAREILKSFHESDVCGDLMIDSEEILSGDVSKIKSAIGHMHMAIILSNLSDSEERELACKVAAVGKSSGVLTLVYNLVPFKFKDSGKKMGAGLVNSAILKTDLYLAMTENEQSEPLEAKAKNIKDAIDAATKMVVEQGMICVDISDFRSVICTGKLAVFGRGVSSDIPNALESALSCDDINNINTSDISGMHITLTAGMSLTLEDFTLLGDLIELKASDDCLIVMGTILDTSFNEEKQVSVIFNGPELY